MCRSSSRIDGRCSARQRVSSSSVAGLGGDAEVGLGFEQHLQTRPDDRVVVAR